MALPNISINEFAKRIGVSRQAVLKAIESGKISGDAIAGNKRSPRIVEELAKKQWADNYAPRATQSAKLEAALGLVIPGVDDGNSDDDDQTQEQEEDGSDVIKLSKRATMAEAKRVEAIHRAKIAGLDLRERKNELIDKVKAEKEYFAIGSVIRASLQGLPDKVLDNLLACQTRGEAHEYLTREITECLEALSKPPEL